MNDSHPDVKIGYVGYGAYLPAHVVTNTELEQVVDTSDEWIRRRTGVRTRRILDKNETILDMTVAAARRALVDAGISAERIDDIRVGVNTWMRFPSLATQLQKALGSVNASASDVSAGCAGFIYAVEDAYNKIYLERVKYGRNLISLVVGVDGLSHITNWTDRGTCVLLGDGAGAVLMTVVETGGILAAHTSADGRYGDLLYSDFVITSQSANDGNGLFTHERYSTRPYLHMEGRRVFSIAVKTMADDVLRVLERHNRQTGERVGVSDIGYVYPHQANLRIIEAVAQKLDIPLEKVYTEGIVRYGNTSAASIPIGYCETRPHLKGRLEVDVAFGAGFASGAILRRVS